MEPASAVPPYEPEPPPSDEVRALVPRRRTWPVVAVILGVLAVVAFFVVRASRAPRPLRVLVAVDVNGYWWEGSEAAAALSDKLGQRLGALGFDPVKAGDPEATKILEKSKSPEDAASALQAAFVITARIVPEVIQHDVANGAYYETRADADVSVHHVDRKPEVAGKLVTFSGAKDKQRSVHALAVSLADQAFDAVLPKIMGDPSIQELLADRQSNIGPAIFPARDYLAMRDKATKAAWDAWDKLRQEHLSKEEGKVKPTFLSAPGAHDELTGSGPHGALISSNDVRPFFIPDNKSLGWINELETLDWRSDPAKNGAPGEVLFKGYNIFGYPGAAPSGAPAVLIEDLFGWAKTVTVIEAGAKPKRVKIDPEHRFVEPKVSPGGKLIALYDRPCPDCAADLVVLQATDGKEMHRSAHEGGVFGSYAWIDATHLAFLHTPAQDTDDIVGKLHVEGHVLEQALWVVDLGASPPALVGTPVPKGDSYSLPSAAPNGDLAFERRDGQRSIAIWTRATNTFSAREVPGFPRAPSWSPDSSKIVFVLVGGGAEEIAIAPRDATAGEVRVLTKNPYADRYPQFSADGSKIYYETVDEDPNWPGHRNVSWIAVLPSAP